nr:DUF5011 domain-containing protein [Clostridia bacterium]
SWMCPNPSGYALEWTDAFPITCDGVWEISYSDPFGTVHEEIVELTDVFGNYGIQLDFSTLDYTTEPVAVTATQAAGFASLGQPDLSESWGFAYGQKSLTIEAEENSTIRIFSFEPGLTAGYWYDDVADVLDIHVTNIVQPVPEATVWLYFESLQNAFIAGSPEQPTGEIPGAVTVYYRTDREVSPSSPDSLVIRPGDAGDFSFAYYDAVSNADYTITGNLSDYGIVLAADPDAADHVDTEAPSIDHVAIWAMQGGVFSQANSFNGAADEAAITDAFSENTTGWAQGYDLVLNASDYSKWKLLAFAAQPTEVSFTSTGDALEGVAIQANNVLLTEELAGDVYIVCVDNAAAETGAAADNFTCIKIPYSALRFDNQAPEIFHTDNSATDLYERVVYLRGTDDHTDASVIAFSGEGVELNPGTDADHPASVWPYRVVFHQNGSLLVTAKDQAGNTSSLPIDVDNIDSRTPTLSVTWSPCFKDEDTGEMIESSPTAGPVNLDVIAHVTSNMPIYDVKATVIGTSPDVPELREEAEVYFADKVDTSYPAYGPTVAGAFDDQLVSIYFRGSGEVPHYPDPAQPDYVMVPYDQEVMVRVYAPNGQSAAVTLTLPGGTIDQVSPDVWFEYEPVVREGFEDAYQEKVKALFDEDVYCIGGPGVVPGNTVYSAANPYVVTLTDMEETGAYTFVDMAGNLLPDPNDPGARPVTFKADSGMIIDSSAPVLSLETPGAASGEEYRAELRFTDDRSYFRLEVTGPAAVTVGAAGSPQTDADGNTYWVIPLTLASTGNFTAVGFDKAGNAARLVFTVDSGDLTPPIMSFSPSTVTLTEGASAAELTEKLEAGIALWDNGTGEADLRASLICDDSAVQLNRPGVYTVIYTAADNAGNVATAARSVKIISASLPAVTVDGDPTELNGTLSISVGRHQLSVGNLQIPGEPCRVILVKGRWSEGQLKLVDEGLAVDESGWFDLDAEGFYTLYILTQSRQSYRTLLYAE